MVSAVQGHGNCDSKLAGLIQASSLPPDEGIALHGLLLLRLALFSSLDVELKETPVSTFSGTSPAI